MTLDHSALLAQLDALKSADSGAVFAELIRSGLQQLIEAEATAAIGAGRYERSDGRTVHRNGHRPKTVSTTAGDIEVQIPKLRAGSFFPSLLEPRRRIDKALHAVIMEAYVHGVSTRSVDDLVTAMGVQTGVSKSEVSRICAGLDREITAFRERSLTHTSFPYVFCDATFCKVRVGAHVVSQALVVATGVSIDGTREVLGTAVGDSESFEFWREFLASLKARGLSGGAPGHLRCARWVESRCGTAVHELIVAAVPGAFHAEPAYRGIGQTRPRRLPRRSRPSSLTPNPTRSPRSGTGSPTPWPRRSRRWPR
ncbi:hypothetical protein MTY66_18740 [Mycolicibacterium sp. TY66]|nr:hypothetical protein MTY66_18740 [Mycolicibacterium sp. TY66]